MKKVTYFEKLKDPRWQQKRLEIFSRDNFNCQLCHDETSPLHIHHKNYFFNLDPWEYKNEDLITLCENCHQQETLLSQTISKEILIFLKRNFSMYDLYMFNNTLKDMNNISLIIHFKWKLFVNY